MKNKISVIVPWYEDEFVMETLGTILEQTRQPDEIVVVNDGSKNNLDIWKMIEDMAKIDNRFHLISLPVNQGIGAVRKIGTQVATGDWIAFLSSDDLWKPNFLQEMELCAQRHPNIDVIYCDYERIDAKGNVIKVQKEYHMDDMEDFRVHIFQRHNVNFSAAFFRAQPLKKVSLDEKLRFGEDYLCLLKLARDYNFKHIFHVLAKYRIHEQQATNLFLDKIAENDRKIKERAREYYEKRL